MKFPSIPTAALAIWLAASPSVAEEKAHVATQTETAGSVTAKTREKTGEVMFGQMTAIQAQLGLHRGSVEAAKQMKASAQTQAEALTAEAEAVLGADATPQDIREFFRARVAGYRTVAEMKQDIAVVLGENPNPGTVKAYLLLRRVEIEGLSGREADFEALRAEVRALGDLKVGELRGLLREKIRVSVDRDDAGKKGKDKDKDNADAPEDRKPEDAKDEHKLLHVELKAEHRAWHEGQKDEQAEARQDKLETRIEARVDELEARTEARLENLEAKMEAKVEEIQAKAEARMAELEARRQKIEAKAKIQSKAELEARRQKAEAKAEARQEVGMRIGGSDASDDRQ